MKTTLLLLIGAPVITASSLGLLSTDSAASSPTSLAQAYAKELPKLGPLMPKELLRDHIRRDLLPRLMSTQDDRTAYELGLNIFEKINKREGSLVEINQAVSRGEKLDQATAKSILEEQQDLSSDLELLGEKIKDDGNNNGVSFQTLRLLANSAQSYACAYKATEIAVLSKGKDKKKDCAMPFPGSFIMLDQKIQVPAKVNLVMPPADDANYLQPQEWMKQHMRHKVWCPDSFSKHGFEQDVMCDAVTAAMDMPRHDEISEERSSLLQLEEAKKEGKTTPAVASPVVVPAVGAAVMMEQQAQVEQAKIVSEGTAGIMQQVAENQRLSQEMAQKAEKSRSKLNLLQKRSKLRQLKEKLMADKVKLAMM